VRLGLCCARLGIVLRMAGGWAVLLCAVLCSVFWGGLDLVFGGFGVEFGEVVEQSAVVYR
jgi:hypothetical protein